MNRRAAITFIMTTVLSIVGAGCSSSSAGSDSDMTPNAKYDGATASAGVIRVATTGDSKPNSFTQNGEQKGFDVELLNYIAKQAGYTTTYVTMDFSAVLATVKNGQADIAVNSISRTPERLETVDFSDPYYLGYAAITTTESTGIADPSGLSAKRVGFLKGSIYEDYTTKQYPNAEPVAFPDLNSAMGALSSGTIDGYFGDLPPVQDFQDKNPDAKVVVLSMEPVTDLPVAAAIRQGNDAMKSLFNDGLKIAFADGTWEKLYKKWFPNQPIPTEFNTAATSASPTSN